jgi:ABC-type lipoprotein release transport system permease subunit
MGISSKTTRVLDAMGPATIWPATVLVRALTLVFSGTSFGTLLGTVSLRRMRYLPLRTSAATFGIAIGVAVLAAVAIVNRSILSGVAATTVELAGKADLQITGGAGGLRDAVLEQVRDVPEITVATPITEHVASAFGPGGQRERLLLMGIDFLGTAR